jgi:hypothetical protein
VRCLHTRSATLSGISYSICFPVITSHNACMVQLLCPKCDWFVQSVEFKCRGRYIVHVTKSAVTWVPVITAWHMLGLQMKETASRYAGYLQI